MQKYFTYQYILQYSKNNTVLNRIHLDIVGLLMFKHPFSIDATLLKETCCFLFRILTTLTIFGCEMELKRKASPLRIRIRKHKRTPPGASPGSINLAEDAPKPRLTITSFGMDHLLEMPVSTLLDIKKRIEQYPNLFHWIEIRGFGDKQLLEDICTEFDIHRLEIEDVINTYQRPKLEEYPDHLFIISRLLSKGKDDMLHNDQLSLFMFSNLVITMQETYEDGFEAIRTRLRAGKTVIRNGVQGYFTYALLDAVVDTYFPILENIGEKLDELEDELFLQPNRASLQKIQSIKRELIVFRRTVFAERDKVNDLLRTNTKFIDDQTRVYLRDTYDHTIQVMDLVESYKEITASLMDIYLSSVSNRMNQIMKVLAVISTIFIPLTFIVGVYGMNFADVDPLTNQALPMNMPELYHPLGYVGVMLFMLIIVVIQLLVFWRKGCLDKT